MATLNPMVRDYLMRKRGVRPIVDMETPVDEAVQASIPDPVRAPVAPDVAPDEAPDQNAAYDAVADLKAAQEQTRQEAATNRMLEGAQEMNNAFTGAGVDKFGTSNAVGAAKDRATAVRDYLLQKYRGKLGDAQMLNAQAAYNNSVRERKAPTAKEPDPLDDEAKRARIALTKAQTEKTLRPPVVKPAKGNTGPKLRELPAGEAATLGELKAADAMAEELGKAFGDAKSMASFALKYFPGTNAAAYGDVKLAAAQMIGTIMEGGKLTDSDLQDKYLKLVPDQTDSKARATQKIAMLRRMLAAKREGRLSGFKGANFDVSGFDQGNAATTPPQSSRVVVTNGTETLEIDADDLADAMKDGYRRAE